MDRLVYIVNICPPLAVPALQLAAQHIFKTRDVDLYRNTVSAYDAVAVNAQLPPGAEVAPLDQAWYEEWSSKNLAEKTRLEVELKTYTSNMIKESVRVCSTSLEDWHPLIMRCPRWLTETLGNFSYLSGTIPVLLNTLRKSENRAQPVSTLWICVLQSWRWNHPLLGSWSTQYLRN